MARATSTVTPSSSQQGKKRLRVGILLRLDDRSNLSVHSLDRGIETAKEVFEAEHSNVSVELTQFSFNENLDTVRSQAERFINSGIPTAIGGEWSSEALILGDILGKARLVFISPTATNPMVTEGKPYAFRACFSDDVAAARIAKYTLEKIRPASLGMIHNTSSPYSNYLSQRFFEAYSEGTAKLPEGSRPQFIREQISTAIPPEHSTSDNYEINYSTQIQKFIDAKVTHVAMLGFWGDLSPFLTQAKAHNFYPMYIGGDGWGSDSNIRESAEEEHVDLTKFTAYRYYYWNKDKKTPFVQRFRATYERKYGVSPEGLDAIGFDSAWVLFTAMNHAADPNNANSVREELIKLRQVELITADQFQFEQKNSPNTNMHLYKFSGSVSTFIETLR